MPGYIALLRKESGSDYGVEFPDFPGCVTAGCSLDEARAMAQEALEFHIAGLAEDREALPEPSEPEVVMGAPGNADAVAFLVSVAARKPRARRVNVTLPEDLLRRIDKVARHRGMSRSSFLARAAAQAIDSEPAQKS